MVALVLACALLAPCDGAAQTAVEPVERTVPVPPETGVPAAPAIETEVPGARDKLARRPRLAGIELRLSTRIGYDDNVLRTENDKRAAFVLNARPRATLNGAFGKHRLQLGYEGNYALYHGLGGEDFDDHKLLLALKLDLHRKLDTNLEAGIEYGHDPRAGTDVRLAQSRTPDQWTSKRVAGEVVVGRRVAKAQIGLSSGYSALRFTNNAQQARDRNRVDFKLTGYWNVGRKLSLLLEPSLAYVDFTSPAAALDSRETRLLAGARWEATFKTAGELKVGYLVKDFADPGEEDFAGISWRGQVLWRPKSFSSVRLVTAREAQESTQPGANLVNSHLDIAWRHAFTRRLEVRARLQFDRAEFSSGREDDLVGLRADIKYGLLRWLEVGAEYRFGHRASNFPGAGFTNNIYLLNLIAAFDHRPRR